jgi:hypothetical protein
MVRHIVFWRFADEADGRGRAENIDRARERLLAMAGRIEGLIRLEVEANAQPSPDASDLALVADFTCWAALRTYADHPVHQAVVQFLRQVRSERRVVDYEI